MPFLVCPACGEYNPPDAESCQVCQASLANVTPTEEPAPLESGQGDFDLLTPDEADLPGLLESLKQDDLPTGPDSLSQLDLLAGSEDASQEGKTPGGEKTPDWLDVVRKRAREEEDAVGDLVKRVSGAQENIKPEKRESRHDDFENWIQKLRDEARDKAAGGPPPQEEVSPAEEEAEEDEPEWLKRIRKAEGIPEEKPEPDAAGRSLLEWLVELEEQRTSVKTPEATEATQEVALPQKEPEPGATQKIRISETLEKEPLSTLNLTREDREQADQLVSTIADESADRPSEAAPRLKPLRILGIFFALILMIGISFMLITGRVVSFIDPELSPAGQAVLDWAAGLPEDAVILIVFDYQPAYAPEVERIARPVLSELFGSIKKVDVVSSSAAGVLLSAEMLSDFPEIEVTDRGYVPGESFGAFGFASGVVSGSAAVNLPEPAQTLETDPYLGVLILSDQFESAQGWVEQMNILAPETTVNLLVTAQSGPMLQPYVDSGQVNGMVSGLAEAVAVEAGLGEKGPATAIWQAYQVGILVMIGALVLGGAAGFGGNRRMNGQGGQ